MVMFCVLFLYCNYFVVRLFDMYVYGKKKELIVCVWFFYEIINDLWYVYDIIVICCLF